MSTARSTIRRTHEAGRWAVRWRSVLTWCWVVPVVLLTTTGCSLSAGRSLAATRGGCGEVGWAEHSERTGALAWAERRHWAAMIHEPTDPASAAAGYRASLAQSWQVVANTHDANTLARGLALYRWSLARWLNLVERHPSLAADVPRRFEGFVWQVDEFAQQHVVRPSGGRVAGLGVPVVITGRHVPGLRPEEAFLTPHRSWPATVVLRPGPGGRDVLEYLDPLRMETYPLAGRRLPLNANIEAALDEMQDQGPRLTRLGFWLPDDPSVRSRLRMIEPYQPGKIPVVFVHGLLSDPMTWVDMAAGLREEAWVNERYQFWAFRYPTGQAFLGSAADLRRELRRALATVDPEGHDPALRNMVIVGHSMGGLISKLLATSSDDHLWRSISRVPFDEIRAPEVVKSLLADRLFFQHEPYVKRIVMIAAPHKGASAAARPLGRLGSRLVQPNQLEQAMLDRLLADNPGALDPSLAQGLPKSVDLLEPSSPLLRAMYPLPIAPHIASHTIVGTGYYTPLCDWGDRVVPIDSAALPGVTSQAFVHAPHTRIQKHPAAIAEVRRILALHQEQALHQEHDAGHTGSAYSWPD